MKLMWAFALALTTFLTFVSTYEMDFSLELEGDRGVYESQLHELNEPVEVYLFVSKFHDGLDRVLDNKVEVWSDGKDYSCEYVKVFYKGKKPQAVKLLLRTKKFWDIARVYDKNLYFLEKEGKLTGVEKKDYYDFLDKNEFPNYAHKDYEKDEKFYKSDGHLVVDKALNPLLPEPEDFRPKVVPRRDVPPAPGNDNRDQPSGPKAVNQQPKDIVVPDQPKENKEADKDKKPKNLKKKKDSFLTISVIPAILLTLLTIN